MSPKKMLLKRFCILINSLLNIMVDWLHSDYAYLSSDPPTYMMVVWLYYAHFFTKITLLLT
jgi:hypothetical protein